MFQSREDTVNATFDQDVLSERQHYVSGSPVTSSSVWLITQISRDRPLFPAAVWHKHEKGIMLMGMEHTAWTMDLHHFLFNNYICKIKVKNIFAYSRDIGLHTDYAREYVYVV